MLFKNKKQRSFRRKVEDMPIPHFHFFSKTIHKKKYCKITSYKTILLQKFFLKFYLGICSPQGFLYVLFLWFWYFKYNLLCIFWAWRFLHSPDLPRIFGLGTLGSNCWLFNQKNSVSFEALSLVNIFHRQRRCGSRSGVSPNFFSAKLSCFPKQHHQNSPALSVLSAQVTELVLRAAALPVPAAGLGWEGMGASHGVPALSRFGVQDISIHSLQVHSDFCFTSEYV